MPPKPKPCQCRWQTQIRQQYFHFFTLKLVVAPTTPIERRRRLMATSNANADIANNNSLWPSISSSYGDPCLDLFFNALRPEWRDANPCLTYLEQLLPSATSHNPLTTLELIFTFDSIDFSDTKFDTVMLWLHHNHPKTLLRNLHSIANLPLVRYAHHGAKGDGLVRKEDFQEEAELQWKAMVEEIKQGEGLGKFKNCLVVGYGGLGYKEWSYPEADLIEGHDLTSKFEFMRSARTSCVQLNEERRILEAFDLILEVAVNEYLKAEQMIKKVIMFTNFLERPDSRIWGIQYDALRSNFEAIRSKFRYKGYGDDVVPLILYFNEHQDPWICTQHPGFTISWKQPSRKIIKLSR
ncbi:unnamed protein product [Prunus brigantina]